MHDDNESQEEIGDQEVVGDRLEIGKQGSAASSCFPLSVALLLPVSHAPDPIR